MHIFKRHFAPNLSKAVYSAVLSSSLVVFCYYNFFCLSQVDMLRLQKDEDLERYRRESERRQRSWGDIDMDASMI